MLYSILHLDPSYNMAMFNKVNRADFIFLSFIYSVVDVMKYNDNDIVLIRYVSPTLFTAYLDEMK